MNFLQPIGFLALTAFVPVVLLYFLKLRREERLVPSTLLWKQVIEDLQVNSPFQRIRYSLLLLLQLIALGLITFALARPYLNMRGITGKQVILLVDTSGSMKTLDAKGRTRIEAAKDDAMVKVDDLTEYDEMMVVAFDKDVRQLTPKFTNVKGILRDCIRSVEARDMETGAGDAIETCRSLCEGNPRAEILLLSDGAFAAADRAGMTGLGDQPFRFISYGEASDNVGLVNVSVRSRGIKAYDQQGMQTEATESQIFAMVENFSAGKAKSTVEVFLDDRPAGGKTVELDEALGEEEQAKAGASGAQRSGNRCVEVFKLPLNAEGVVKVRVTTPGDRFAVDDEATAFVSSKLEGSVLIVSDGNYFLDKVIANVSRLDFTKMKRGEFEAAYADKGAALIEAYDACLFDGVGPKRFDEGGALFLGVVPPIPGYEDLGVLEGASAPHVNGADDSHPAMRFVNFENVDLVKAIKLGAPRKAWDLVWAEKTPLISAYETDRLRALTVAFDPFESNWPLRSAFPLFVKNSLFWLIEGSPRHRGAALRTGQPVIFYPDKDGLGTVTVLAPGGGKSAVELSPESKTYFRETYAAGIYTIEGFPKAGQERKIAVNLASRSESDNGAQPELKTSEGKIKARTIVEESNREIWRHLALIFLALILIEWWVYHRRVGM